MLAKLVRAAGLLGFLLGASVPDAPAATQREIDQAVKNGTAALKAQYGRAPGGGAPGVPGGPPPAAANVGTGEYGIGPAALAGLALLEAGVPVTDQSIKNITEAVRNASFKETQTYQVSLCLMYLDRLGEPSDVILIQMLGVRLLAGQTKDGGWGYGAGQMVPQADQDRLREAAKQAQLVAGGGNGGKDPPKLHSEIEKYALSLAKGPLQMGGSDNSNTQFAVLALWMARKHGVPVENALKGIEDRFMAQQDSRTGNWPYNPPLPVAIPVPPPGGLPPVGAPNTGSPAMYCSGLLAMATSLARREEKRPKDPPAGTKPDAPAKPNDPFYNPPAGGGKDPPKPGAGRPADVRDLIVQRAFAGLGLAFAEMRLNNKLLGTEAKTHGMGDLYFLWSLERVGVIYGVDKIGGLDWYDVGSTVIVNTQSPNGTWVHGIVPPDVNTAFAVLFLLRSNLARDLSSKVQRDPTSTELKAGTGPSATDLLPNRPTGGTSGSGSTGSTSVPAPINLPNPTGDASLTLATNLLKATGNDWTKLLGEARDSKGPNFTRALVVTAKHADGERKKEARDALAERLCRMTPATLRGMLKADDVELRRAAALACAMKDDKDHIPDLIAALEDADDSVMRAAKAGLKSLSGKDFGPAANATPVQKTAAIAAWKDWYAKEKK